MRFNPRLLVPIVAALLAGGCFASFVPLISQAEADFPLPEGYWEECSGQRNCRVIHLVRDGHGYYQSAGSSSAGDRFRVAPPTLEGRRLVQFARPDEFVFGLLLQRGDAWSMLTPDCGSGDPAAITATMLSSGRLKKRGSRCVVPDRASLELLMNGLAEAPAKTGEMRDLRLLDLDDGRARYVDQTLQEVGLHLSQAEWDAAAMAAGVVYRANTAEGSRIIAERLSPRVAAVQAWQAEQADAPDRRDTLIWFALLSGNSDIAAAAIAEQTAALQDQAPSSLTASLYAAQLFGVQGLLGVDLCRPLQAVRYQHVRLEWPTSAWVKYLSDGRSC